MKNKRIKRNKELSYMDIKNMGLDMDMEQYALGGWLKDNWANVATGIGGAALLASTPFTGPAGIAAGSAMLGQSVSGFKGVQDQNAALATQNEQTAAMAQQSKLNMANQRVQNTPLANNGVIAKYGGKLPRYKRGGSVSELTTMPGMNMLEYGGQTHEGMNGGVNIDGQGNTLPSKKGAVGLAEGKEVSLTDSTGAAYILSDTLKNDKNTFAKDGKKLIKQTKFYNGLDPITNNYVTKELNKLQEQQEVTKQVNNIRAGRSQVMRQPEFKMGGELPKYDGTEGSLVNPNPFFNQTNFGRQANMVRNFPLNDIQFSYQGQEQFNDSLGMIAPNVNVIGQRPTPLQRPNVLGGSPSFQNRRASGDSLSNTNNIIDAGDPRFGMYNEAMMPDTSSYTPQSYFENYAKQTGFPKNAQSNLQQPIAPNVFGGNGLNQYIAPYAPTRSQQGAAEYGYNFFNNETGVAPTPQIQGVVTPPTPAAVKKVTTKAAETTTQQPVVQQSVLPQAHDGSIPMDNFGFAGQKSSFNLAPRAKSDNIYQDNKSLIDAQATTPTPESTDNLYRGMGWGDAALSALPGIASGIINSVAANRLQAPDKLRLSRMSPQQISLERERQAAREQANLTRSNTSRGLRGNVGSIGQYMANMGNTQAGIGRGLSQQLGQSYMNEELQNAQFRQQADMANMDANTREQMYNNQLQNQFEGSRRNMRTQALGQGLGAISGAIGQKMMANQFYDQVNMMNPNFDLEMDGNKWFQAGRTPRKRVRNNSINNTGIGQ